MYKSLLARALTFALVLLLPIALIAEGCVFRTGLSPAHRAWHRMWVSTF